MKNLIILLIFCYFSVSCYSNHILTEVKSIKDRNDYRCDGVSILTTYSYMDICGHPELEVGDTVKLRLKEGFPTVLIDKHMNRYKVVNE